MQAWIYFTQNRNWLIHPSRSSTNFSFKTYASLYKLFFWNLFDLISWVRYQCRTNTECWWTRNTCSPGNVSFYQYLKSTDLFLLHKIQYPCSVACSEIFSIGMRDLSWYLWWIFWQLTTRKSLTHNMVELYNLWITLFDGYQTVLFNSSWKNSISFVVNMLANNVDPARCSGNKISLTLIKLIKLLEQCWVSFLNRLRIKLSNVFYVHLLEHTNL